MDGEHQGHGLAIHLVVGSSPHGRGTCPSAGTKRIAKRGIPAWAGNIRRGRSSPPCRPGHPRMGGEHPTRKNTKRRCCGSSPHGRGTFCRHRRIRRRFRVIPAWAGNIRGQAAMPCVRTGHPRMGGEHRTMTAKTSIPGGSSPHGRGTLSGLVAFRTRERVIPAWAGNMAAITPRKAARTGHPRMGGEHIFGHHHQAHPYGSSPHGRGTFRRC